jgi:hypothetical protein
LASDHRVQVRGHPNRGQRVHRPTVIGWQELQKL